MNIVQLLLILAIRLYRWLLSPMKAALFGPIGQCRYYPTCSQYALEAIQSLGAARGAWMSVRRICRCHPWSDCGYDPVPVRSMRSVADRAGLGRHDSAFSHSRPRRQHIQIG